MPGYARGRSTHTRNGRRSAIMTAAAGRSAFVLAKRVLTIAAAAAVVIVAMMAGRAHAQGNDQRAGVLRTATITSLGY